MGHDQSGRNASAQSFEEKPGRFIFRKGGGKIFMTYSDFKKQVAALQKSRYQENSESPLEFAMKRAEFVEQKLRQLITLADQTKFATARRQKEGWKRQLERSRASRDRFKQVQKEMMNSSIFKNISSNAAPRIQM